MSNPFEQKIWKLAHGRQLELGLNSVIMGVLNVTPDSFSDGGKYFDLENSVLRAVAMQRSGAAIIDVGGESTRPGAVTVTAEEEQTRVLPVIEALSNIPEIIISIDTYRSDTARKAIKAGAHIVNDVWGCQKDEGIAQVVADHSAGLCAMHTGRERMKNDDVMIDQFFFLNESLKVIKSAGVKDEQIVLDPGFGFAKDPDENIELLARFDELNELGYPLLVGTSRKRFIGHFTGRDAVDRDIATAATSVVARMKGGAIFRVHDIEANRDALSIADAVISANYGN